MVFGKKADCFAHYVDPEKVIKVKAEYTANPEDGVAFVSTNDILTSSFAKSISARICMMAINFRNRIEGLVDKDAGNYEGFLLYDEKMYGTPGKVRKVLQKGPPFLSMAKELPGFWESLSCNFGQVTNWSSFAGDLSFEGCKQRLHLPVYDTGMIPFDCAIIFKPLPGKLAVMYFAKTIGRKEILSQCELGEPVSNKIFK